MPVNYQRNHGLQRLPGDTSADVEGERTRQHDWKETAIEVGCGFLMFIALKVVVIGTLSIIFLAQGG